MLKLLERTMRIQWRCWQCNRPRLRCFLLQFNHYFVSELKLSNCFRFRRGFKQVFSCCPFVHLAPETLSRREVVTSRYSCSGSPEAQCRIIRNGECIPGRNLLSLYGKNYEPCPIRCNSRICYWSCNMYLTISKEVVIINAVNLFVTNFQAI